MADDNRFAGLGDALDDEGEDADDEQQADVGSQGDDTESPSPERDISSHRERTRTDMTPDDTGDQSSAEPSKDTPAFPFSETKQDPLYPVEGTWQDYEDTLDFEVRRELREDGYTNIEKRELHEASLRALIENPEIVTEQFRKLRQYE